MSNRRGVLLVIFDLPVKTKEERRQYVRFRKKLLRSGYAFFQKSVYVKLLRNISYAAREIAKVALAAPKHGEIQVLPMNLNVFRSMFSICGEGFHLSEFADDIIFLGDEHSEEVEISDEEIVESYEASHRHSCM